MLRNNIFKATLIAKQIEESRFKKADKKKAAPVKEKNLYEKVNHTFKGMVGASPELLDEMIVLVKDRSAEAIKYLQEMKKKASE